MYIYTHGAAAHSIFITCSPSFLARLRSTMRPVKPIACRGLGLGLGLACVCERDGQREKSDKRHCTHLQHLRNLCRFVFFHKHEVAAAAYTSSGRFTCTCVCIDLGRCRLSQKQRQQRQESVNHLSPIRPTSPRRSHVRSSHLLIWSRHVPVRVLWKGVYE